MTDSMEEIINDLREKKTVKQETTRMNRFIIKTLEVKSSHISWSQMPQTSEAVLSLT